MAGINGWPQEGGQVPPRRPRDRCGSPTTVPGRARRSAPRPDTHGRPSDRSGPREAPRAGAACQIVENDVPSRVVKCVVNPFEVVQFEGDCQTVELLGLQLVLIP